MNAHALMTHKIRLTSILAGQREAFFWAQYSPEENP
jgi:hypothetical protein